MAAERLFSLELLVDWVRLEAAPPPGPAVAFRLLDFPPLLVRAPASPAPAPGGALGFGRGKACVFRLRPAALRRCPRLRAALLQLPAASGPPSPRLLGACDVPLPAVRAPGSRRTFALRDPAGERVGDLALFCRLTELEEAAPRRAEPDPAARDSIVPHHAEPEPARPADHGRPSSAEAAGSGPCNPYEEDVELDLETNTICPPPLCYTHLAREKTHPAGVKITIEPQSNPPEELDGALPGKVLINLPTHLSPPKGTRPATQESPPGLLSSPQSEDVGAFNQSTCHPQTEQNTINTIRQLPLLNALLIELSLLYNQPLASPTHIHPHLAWLYRSEDKKAPESPAKSTCQFDPKKDKLSVGDQEKAVSPQRKKNQVENLKKGKYFENSGTHQKRVPGGRLLYGLTNTLRLRLKQTNPDMLVVHEKREEYRKMQAQMLGPKFRIPSSKVLSFAEESQNLHQLPREKHLDSDAFFAENSDTSRQISGVFDEPSTTRETKLNCATEKKTVACGENRTSSCSLEGPVNPAGSIVPEGLTHTHILEGKLEMKAQSPSVVQQDAVADRIVDREIGDGRVRTKSPSVVQRDAVADRIVDREIGDGRVRTAEKEVPAVEMSENRSSKNSCHESISEGKYSDDFTSPCYSEDFYPSEDSSKSLQTHSSSLRTENPHTSKSSGARQPMRKSSSEKGSIPSPPFSAGSPVLSQKRCHLSKTRGKNVEEASSNSTSNSSSPRWTEVKESQIDRNRMHNSKVVKGGQDFSIKAETGCKCSGKSQSPRTSQVSSYLPSNLSELELNVLGDSTSDHFEEDDDIGSLRISKQCKDICDLVMNKLPGYTV